MKEAAHPSPHRSPGRPRPRHLMPAGSHPRRTRDPRPCRRGAGSAPARVRRSSPRTRARCHRHRPSRSASHPGSPRAHTRRRCVLRSPARSARHPATTVASADRCRGSRACPKPRTASTICARRGAKLIGLGRAVHRSDQETPLLVATEHLVHRRGAHRARRTRNARTVRRSSRRSTFPRRGPGRRCWPSRTAIRRR